MPHLYSNPAILSFHAFYHFLAVPFPFCLSSTCPPQGFPLLLSWLPAAPCEVGFRLLNWALTALLSLALMQVEFHLLFDFASLHFHLLFHSQCSITHCVKGLSSSFTCLFLTFYKGLSLSFKKQNEMRKNRFYMRINVK